MTESQIASFDDWMHESVKHIEWVANDLLPKPGREPRRLIGAMRYAVLGGGKRIRALLCYAAGAVSGAETTDLDRAALALELVHAYSLVHDDMPSMDNDTLRRGKPTVHVQYGEATAMLAGDAFLALELVHAYSLVHDDMPSMDNDTLRRGKPTVHVQYGEATAMLAGDALQTEAFTVLAGMKNPVAVARLCGTLARAAGVRGMCGGQALDLAMVGGHPGEGELLMMQAMKTGALIQAAVLMGAQAGDWDRLGDGARGGLAAYADALGVAFQVVDDILDCTQDTATLGKTAGKDEKDDKPTWVSLLGLEGAKERARQLHDRANEALALQDTATLGKTAGKDEKDDKPTWVSLLGLEGAKERARQLHDRANEALALVSADPAVPDGAVVRLQQIADYVIARSH